MLSGVFQCDGSGLTPRERLEKLGAVLKHKNLDLIVCPELFLSGYNVPDELPAFAQTPDSAMMDQVAKIARKNETAIVYGYPELEGKSLYNVAACLSAKGEMISKHKKLAIPPGFEMDIFKAGDGLTLFDLAGFRCGILICYEAEFPECVRALAQAGAELVIVPTALSKNWSVVAEAVMRARAFENGVWLIYANHAGVENDSRYLGASCIVSPFGEDAARAGSKEQLIIAQLDLELVGQAQNRLPYLKDVADLRKKLKVSE